MTSPTEMIQRISRLAPLSEIYAGIDAIAKPVAPREVDLAAATGCVLAADVMVAAPMPPRAVALRDGWAVNSDLVADAGSYAPVPLMPAPAFVEIGEPMPAAADAVLAPDAVAITKGSAEALAAATPGDGVLAAGADADTRSPLRRSGERLRAVDVAVLRAAGVSRVVVREPCVRVFCANARIDEATDAVGPLMVRALEIDGARTLFDRASAGRALEHALLDDAVDAVIVIGGTGAGKRDASVKTLARMGRVDIHGMGVRPGETAALGVVDSRPVLLLPGRLDAALAAWLIAGQRLLSRLTGLNANEPPVTATLSRKVVSTVGLAEIVPVGRCEGGIEPLASGHFPLRALARADGWIFIPPVSEGYPAGATVELRTFP